MCPTTRALSRQHISNELLAREFRYREHVTLFPDRNFAPSYWLNIVVKDRWCRAFGDIRSLMPTGACAAS